MKVAFLIPSTTKGRTWTNMEETYLFDFFGKSFLETLSKNIEYTIYINIDHDDPIYANDIEKNKFISMFGENISIKFLSDGQIQKGYLTQMWNYLFKMAYDDDNEYFYLYHYKINYLI